MEEGREEAVQNGYPVHLDSFNPPKNIDTSSWKNKSIRTAPKSGSVPFVRKERSQWLEHWRKRLFHLTKNRSLRLQRRSEIILRSNTMDWDDPKARLELINRVGPQEYERLQQAEKFAAANPA